MTGVMTGVMIGGCHDGVTDVMSYVISDVIADNEQRLSDLFIIFRHQRLSRSMSKWRNVCGK